MRLCVMLLLLLPLLCLASLGRACLTPEEAYRFTGAVCRLTYPAALVLNEKTTRVIEAAFQHAKYPSIEGEKNMMVFGKVSYGLHNLEIHNLSIGRSEVELRAGEGIGIAISNVSAVFKGTIKYGYGSWLIKVSQTVDFEIESQIDLGINPKLYCGAGKVAADTSDCYLTFHKLKLILQGQREPGWLRRVFTDFVTFTVKLVIKGQICKEINNVANILADFVQDQAEQFLSDGNIGVDIGVTSAPAITSNYIESYHKGLITYNNTIAVIDASVFHPSQLTEDRMLYFWISDEVLNPIMSAAHHDGRFVRNITGAELTDLFKTDLSTEMPASIKQILSSEAAVLTARSVRAPQLWNAPDGTHVKAVAAVELFPGPPSSDSPSLYFETEVEVCVHTSYAEKKLILNAKALNISIDRILQNQDAIALEEALVNYFREAVAKIGISKVTSYLEPSLTALMDRQGLYLFDIINPEVVTQNGYVVVQMGFGFPHHLLVEFLKKTLV
ncbi:cholesteryl ester transfer protein [Clupea harengus]|uniref:Cholesteryl ester transfer protein n=1 Tax=Clupea harengus TaxID=7950 RepID=A0A6P3VKD4_CLUHA|nr:cholesteryl ester transfer protein [Clupea harengus]